MTNPVCRLASLLLAALAILASAANQPATQEWRQRHQPADDSWRTVPQRFVYNSGAEPETLDPHLATALDAFRLVQALFEGLVDTDPETLAPRPAVAANWDISADGLLYTFHLRPNAKWSDGQPLTSRDFVRSFERALQPSTAAPYAELFFHLAGAESFYRGQAGDFRTVGVEAVDDHTLRLRLAHPCCYFIELLALPVFYPVRVERIEQHADRWTRAGNLIGNGAFVLATWQPRDRLSLRRNPNYWDAPFVKLDEIVALCVDDLNTAYRLYLEGQIHWLPSLPQPRIDEIRRHPDYYVTPFLGTYFYRFNVSRPPFDDPRVRQAFGRATDRREITEQLLRGGQLPVASFCPAMPGYEPVSGLDYDVAAARALLAAAGYDNQKNPFPTLELTYNTDEGHKQIAEAIAAQWKRNLGVNVVTRNLEWKVFLDDMKQLNYQICRSAWIGDYGDPSTFFNIFESGSGNNRTGWKNPEYDTLLARSRTTADPDLRRQLFQTMERLLVEQECPILPIYRYVNTGLLAETVGGFYQNVRNLHPFKYLWLEPQP